MTGPLAQILPDGRLHLQHGPIDLLIRAEGPGAPAAVEVAGTRFRDVLTQLVDELPFLRREVSASCPSGPVARRMHRAALRHADRFVTPMAAVAGSVADEILSVMKDAGPLTRAYVNNGGDIALHLAGDTRFSVAMRGEDNGDRGTILLTAPDSIGGIATSGRGGRSHSMGIADSVTVLASDAASADVAATLIANAVDLPGHPEVLRTRARDLDPDSDLGDRLVVTGLGRLSDHDIADALKSGLRAAEAMRRRGLIRAAMLCLDRQVRATICSWETPSIREAVHA